MKYREIVSGFRGETNEPLPPSKTIAMAPGDFADEWSKKPRSNIVVGLRLLPAEEDQVAERQAIKSAVEAYPGDGQVEERAQEYLDTIRAWCVARSLCDPNDVTKSHPNIPLAEDTIRSALTGVSIARLFDEIERHHVDSSPLFPEATDDDLLALASLISKPENMTALQPSHEARCRRYARFVLTELLDASTLEMPEEGVEPLPDP